MQSCYLMCLLMQHMLHARSVPVAVFYLGHVSIQQHDFKIPPILYNGIPGSKITPYTYIA